MSQFNWESIRTGSTFQSLASALLHFANPSIKQFTRPGPDGSIDALLEQEGIIYQFKYHQKNTSSIVCNDALAELDKIKKLRAVGSGKHWNSATRWVLVTNIRLNPQLLERWQKEIQPAFQQVGLEATLVGIEELENLLIKYPAVGQAYFGGQARAFLSLPEAHDYLTQRQILAGEIQSTLVGRAPQMSAVEAFLKDSQKRILLLKGPGGIGKTRLLFESGRAASLLGFETVYWANLHTFETSTNWLLGVPDTEKALLLIDEPSNPQMARVFLEQLLQRGGPLGTWKVIITLRSQSAVMAPIFEDRRHDLVRIDLELSKLREDDLTALALQLLAASTFSKHGADILKSASQQIAKASGGHPIWTVVGARLVIDRGSLVDLPKDFWGLASEYIEQTKLQTSSTLANPAQVETLLFWLAIYGEIRTDNAQLLEFLSKETQLPTHAIDTLLNNLADRKLLAEIGRIRRLKPDVLRDYILVSRLTETRSGRTSASPFGTAFLKKILDPEAGPTIPRLDKVIESLNLVELIQRLSGSPVDLLSPLISDLTQTISKGEVSGQLASFELAKHFAHARPAEFTEICKALRLSHQPKKVVKDAFWGEKTYDHGDVIIQLPYALVEAARYATSPEHRAHILEEMFELAKAERALGDSTWQRINNDGKRGHRALEKLIFSGPGFSARFDQEASNLSQKELKKLSSGRSIDIPTAHALTSLLKPTLSVQREQTVVEKGTLSITRYLLNPTHKAFALRNEILKTIWALLTPENHKSVRLFVLSLIDDTHRHTQYASADYSGQKELLAEALDDLRRILVFIKHEWVTPAELRAARQIWDWHLEYDKRPDFNTLAKQCEEVFLSKPSSRTFNTIFAWSYERDAGSEHAASVLTQELITNTSGDAIIKMIDAAVEFATEERFWHGAPLVAAELSKSIDNNAVQAFLKSHVGSKNRLYGAFADLIIACHLKHLRTAADLESQRKLLQEVTKPLSQTEQMRDFLTDLYVRPTLALNGPLNEVDFDFFEAHLAPGLALPGSSGMLLAATAKFILVDKDRFKRVVTDHLSGVPPKEITESIGMVIDAFHMQAHFHSENFTLSRQDAEWVFALLLKAPKIDECGSKVEWDLQQLCKKTDFHFTPIEFSRILLERIDTAANSEDSFEILPFVTFDLFQFVRPYDPSKDSASDFITSLKGLIALNDSKYPVGYHLPTWVTKLDPTGSVLPDLINAELAKFDGSSDHEKVINWSRYAGHYPEGSDPWRRIATNAAKLASLQPVPDNKQRILWSLEHRDIEGWSGTYGEFHPRWQEAVDRAQSAYDPETDEYLREYFQLKLMAAKADLEREKLEHKEEHGDE